MLLTEATYVRFIGISNKKLVNQVGGCVGGWGGGSMMMKEAAELTEAVTFPPLGMHPGW